MILNNLNNTIIITTLTILTITAFNLKVFVKKKQQLVVNNYLTL